jgi:peptide-methionine (R)-S-oxide reductase
MSEVVSRRLFVAGLSVLSVAPLIYRATAATLSGPMIGKEVSIENFSVAGLSLGVVRIAKVEKSEAEWRSQLSTLAFRVTRQAATEMAFTGQGRPACVIV